MGKKSGIQGKDLVIIGGLALGGYLLYKWLSGSSTAGTTSGYSGGGGYSVDWLPNDQTPQTPMNQDQNTPTVTPTNPIITPKAVPQITVVETPTSKDIIVTPIASEVVRPTVQYETVQSGITKTITIPAPIGLTSLEADTSQSWTGATYGQPAQPSVTFLENVLVPKPTPVSTPVSKAPSATTGLTPTQTTQMAQAAVAAGAPPRVVAKIKAGSWY